MTQPVTAPRRAAPSWAAALLTVCLASAFAAPANAQADAEVPGEVLLRLRSSADLQPLLSRHALSLRAQFGARPIYRVSVVGAASTHDVVDALALEPAVLDAEPNALHSAPETRRNTPWAIGTPSAYATQWAPQALRLAQAHTLSSGKGVRVAVLDTGIDAAHPAFAGRLLPGFDFVDFDLDPSERFAPGTPFGHGTHVAGLVALAAPGAQIMPLRVLDAQGQGNAWVLAEAMLHAAERDVHVINMSLGSVKRTHMFDTMAQIVGCNLPEPGPLGEYNDPGYNADRARCAASGGAVVIAAAGNDASNQVKQYPAAEGAYALLAITASNAQNRLAGFANFGSWVDIAAPGEGITSALPGGSIAGVAPASTYGTWSGTSMAAPLAAGVAALIRSREPGLSARDTVRRIERSSAPLCGTNAQRQVDAAAALGLPAIEAVACR